MTDSYPQIKISLYPLLNATCIIGEFWISTLSCSTWHCLVIGSLTVNLLKRGNEACFQCSLCWFFQKRNSRSWNYMVSCNLFPVLLFTVCTFCRAWVKNYVKNSNHVAGLNSWTQIISPWLWFRNCHVLMNWRFMLLFWTNLLDSLAFPAACPT